jgi:hypothetical protein
MHHMPWNSTSQAGQLPTLTVRGRKQSPTEKKACVVGLRCTRLIVDQRRRMNIAPNKTSKGKTENFATGKRC